MRVLVLLAVSPLLISCAGSSYSTREPIGRSEAPSYLHQEDELIELGETFVNDQVGSLPDADFTIREFAGLGRGLAWWQPTERRKRLVDTYHMRFIRWFGYIRSLEEYRYGDARYVYWIAAAPDQSGPSLRCIVEPGSLIYPPAPKPTADTRSMVRFSGVTIIDSGFVGPHIMGPYIRYCSIGDSSFGPGGD